VTPTDGLDESQKMAIETAAHVTILPHELSSLALASDVDLGSGFDATRLAPTCERDRPSSEVSGGSSLVVSEAADILTTLSQRASLAPDETASASKSRWPAAQRKSSGASEFTSPPLVEAVHAMSVVIVKPNDLVAAEAVSTSQFALFLDSTDGALPRARLVKTTIATMIAITTAEAIATATATTGNVPRDEPSLDGMPPSGWPTADGSSPPVPARGCANDFDADAVSSGARDVRWLSVVKSRAASLVTREDPPDTSLLGRSRSHVGASRVAPNPLPRSTSLASASDDSSCGKIVTRAAVSTAIF
jgi:hypothetical protein